ncbi:hypothetical protein DT065_12740 [Salicibibacter kimchii]|uniref:Uncharacterized protein n=2 Tax=Salicibibacter kimchii TaxID=2099786 RepID=A0A345C0Q7_9BACI|nr:hypothetical protein DT065_12740 [Salicibibacter kimchii]
MSLHFNTISQVYCLDTVDIVMMKMRLTCDGYCRTIMSPQLEHILGLLGMDSSVYTTPRSSKAVEINKLQIEKQVAPVRNAIEEKFGDGKCTYGLALMSAVSGYSLLRRRTSF